MTKISVGIPQGTRDFGPDTVRKRNYILDTIKNVFELYGFQPLETPAMENLDTLTGKYGEEGDKLIFRVLDSGNPFSDDFKNLLKEIQKNAQDVDNTNKKLMEAISESHVKGAFERPIWEIPADMWLTFLSPLKNEISSKALKYDLTIPFARYVAMNHNKLTFPFKRYQIQPVWRADRPQKGRYREFYQCDADVVGSNSSLNEVELIQIVSDVLKKLKINFEIQFNNRKVLAGISEFIGEKDKLVDITIALDKIEKIGLPKAMDELRARGIKNEVVNQLETMINSMLSKKQGHEMFAELRSLLKDSEIGIKGLDEVESVFDFLSHSYNKESVIDMKFDISLARGLNYYTGSIIEVKPKGSAIGSICGGGSYDDLTGLFGVPGIPGVGISFGVDRIYDVMEEMNLFPADVHVGTQVLFFNLGEAESKKSFELLQQLRKSGIRSELYHEAAKFDKQFKYAEKKNIPYIIVIGEKELQEGTCNIKELATGEQQTIQMKELANYNFKK